MITSVMSLVGPVLASDPVIEVGRNFLVKEKSTFGSTANFIKVGVQTKNTESAKAGAVAFSKYLYRACHYANSTPEEFDVQIVATETGGAGTLATPRTPRTLFAPIWSGLFKKAT